MKNVLIIGATGYLGSYVTNFFLNNNYNVTIIIRKNSKLDRINDIFSLLEIIILDDYDFLNKLNSKSYSIFINASVEYGKGINEELKVLESNVLFPFKILYNLNKDKNFLFFTFDSFYTKPEFIHKNILPSYVLSKIQLNQWLEIYTKREDNINTFILSIEHLVGPNECSSKFNGWLIEKLKSKVSKIDLTNCNQIRDFIYVKDVVSSIFVILQNLSEFNKRIVRIEVGSGKGHSIRKFVELLAKKIKSNVKLNFGALDFNEKNDIMISIANNQKLIDLGWKPITSLEQIVDNILKD